MAAVRWTSRSLLLLLIALLAGGALALWGTGWSLPRAAEHNAAYVLAGAWDGTNIPAGKLDRPIGIAVAPDGDVFVTDAGRRVIHFTASGGFRGQWGGQGSGSGQFENPVGVAVAPDGSVFVSDYDQDRVQEFTPDGKFLLAFGRSGPLPGQFRAPAGLAVDSRGSVYVADFYNGRVQKFTAAGSFVRVVGRAGRIGPGALHYPTGIAATASGGLVVADAYNYQLQWFDDRGRSVRRVGHHLFWLWPRPAAGMQGFAVPTGVAAGGGVLHVADSANHRIVMLTSDGRYLAEWKIPSPARGIYSPEHVAVSPDGRRVYATDFASNRVLVLEVILPAGTGGRSQEKKANLLLRSIVSPESAGARRASAAA